MSYVIRQDGIIVGVGGGGSGVDELVKITATDTTADFLNNKLSAGDFIQFSITNPAGDEGILITATGANADDVLYTPSTLTDWDSDVDPGDVDNALDQLADRVSVLEASSGETPDASAITYNPGVLTNWTGNVDPGEVDNALDQIAARLRVRELDTVDASEITYTPGEVNDWNSNFDPGNLDDAVDQLAERVDIIENSIGQPIVGISATDSAPDYLLDKLVAGTRMTITRLNAGSNETLELAVDPPDAAIVTYTPSTLTSWDSNADPGDLDSALDQLAERVDTLEASFGTTPDASGITYTPDQLSDWTGSVDPGDVDDALDQLAGRVEVLEIATVDASNVGYTPSVLGDWNSSLDPGEVNDALDQIAARLNSTEGAVSGFTSDISSLQSQLPADGSEVTYFPSYLSNWNGAADPGQVGDGLDQLADRVNTLETVPPDASVVTYTPSTLGNWSGSSDPGGVSDALNQLSSRVTTNEGDIATPVAATDVTYAPSTLTDWSGNSDPGDVDDALDQLASRTEVIEVGFNYTPDTLTDWDSDTDPGTLVDAADQLASRLKTLELGGGSTPDASGVTYTPSTLTHWDSDADPGNVDEALDQLADRVDTIENGGGGAVDASGVTYTPTTLTHWDTDTDPGNTDDALDQLADRVDTLENASGPTPDASVVTYTPSTLTNWDSDTDPGNVDAALDQLAERVEAAGGDSAVGFTAFDTTIDESRTIPIDHQSIVVGGVEVVTGGELDVLGEFHILPDPIATENELALYGFATVNTVIDSDRLIPNGHQLIVVDEIEVLPDATLTVFGSLEIIDSDPAGFAGNTEYTPSALTDWTGDADPGNVDDALDQLAGRIQTIEDAGGAGVSPLYTTYDIFAPPITANLSSDEFSDDNFTGWLDWNYTGNTITKIENEYGLALSQQTVSNEWAGIYRSLQSGDFTIDAHLSLSYISPTTLATQQVALVLFENASLSSGQLLTLSNLSLGNAPRAEAEEWNAYDAFSEGVNNSISFAQTQIFARFTRQSSTIRGFFSTDGLMWVEVDLEGEPNGWTPSHFGLAMRTTAVFSDYRMRSRFVRYLNSALTPFDPILGREVTILST